MKEFFDEINSLILDYPEHEKLFEEIQDMCLTEVENGVDKQKAISEAKTFIWEIIKEDEE